MDTWTMLDEIKKLGTNKERSAFVEDQLRTNDKYSAPLHGREYSAKPKALLYMINAEGKITTQNEGEVLQ